MGAIAQEVLGKVDPEVDTLIFPNYESLPERDDVVDPFTEVGLWAGLWVGWCGLEGGMTYAAQVLLCSENSLSLWGLDQAAVVCKADWSCMAAVPPAGHPVQKELPACCIW